MPQQFLSLSLARSFYSPRYLLLARLNLDPALRRTCGCGAASRPMFPCLFDIQMVLDVADTRKYVLCDCVCVCHLATQTNLELIYLALFLIWRANRRKLEWRRHRLNGKRKTGVGYPKCVCGARGIMDT